MELTLVSKGASCCSMELDFDGLLADRAYPILASLVVPRPIALVTTVSPEGKVNAAPFSFFNVLGAEPPIPALAPGDRSHGTNQRILQ
jgi:flavin reductase (DIM6/NTAB) family NADH-FMN oxidoreductase RutF